MTPAELLIETAWHGVKVGIGTDGQLKLTGDRQAAEQWLPVIRAHKAELLALLSVRHRLWRVVRPDGSSASHSLTPSATLAEMMGWYPGCEIHPEPDSRRAAAHERAF